MQSKKDDIKDISYFNKESINEIDLIKYHSKINVKEMSNDDEEELLKLPSKINNNELIVNYKKIQKIP